MGSAQPADGGGEGARGEPAVGQPEPDDVVEDRLPGAGRPDRGVHDPGHPGQVRGDREVPQRAAEPGVERAAVGGPGVRARARAAAPASAPESTA